MGACQSTGETIARSLEDKCGSSGSARRQQQHRKRRRRGRTKGQSIDEDSSLSSSNTEADLLKRQQEPKQTIANSEPRTDESNRSAEKSTLKSSDSATTEIKIDVDSHGQCDVNFEDQAAALKVTDKVSTSKLENAISKQASIDGVDANNNWQSKLDKLKEGVDFIETEEDAKAVEAATLKIQSTFRGKKIRSKLGGGGGASSSVATKEEKEIGEDNKKKSCNNNENEEAACELSKKVAEMQVNDKKDENEPESGANNTSGLPGEEVERAAIKIQAGFKGYKTRKELEAKLPAGSGGGAPAGGDAADQEEARQTAQQS